MGILKNFEGDEHENEYVNPVSQIDVIINPDNFSESSSSEDEEHQTSGSMTNPLEPSLSTVSPPTNRIVKGKKIVSKMPKPILHVKSLGGKKSQGNRQARRHENMCFLLNLAKGLDEDFAEVNIDDLVETTISAFAQVLLNKNRMKIWNEFIELSESEQERFLTMIKTKFDRRCSPTHLSETHIDTFVFIDIPTNETVPSRKKYEAEICFRRIDSNIRLTLKSLLKRNHLPLEQIIWFEDELIPFFNEHPDSIYLRNLNNAFDRMLLHAVCQYLNLISKSTTRDGERYTQVENRRVQFNLPIVRLSNYLKQIEKTETRHN